jgi:hypothetical protein
LKGFSTASSLNTFADNNFEAGFKVAVINLVEDLNEENV